LIPEKDRQNMVDFKEQISVSKQCKVLNLNRNFLYYVPKLESEENLKIMALMDKQYFDTSIANWRSKLHFMAIEK
jgi:putative transposase